MRSSLELAKLFGVSHSNMLARIRKVSENVGIDPEPEFYYLGNSLRKYKMYYLSNYLTYQVIDSYRISHFHDKTPEQLKKYKKIQEFKKRMK